MCFQHMHASHDTVPQSVVGAKTSIAALFAFVLILKRLFFSEVCLHVYVSLCVRILNKA